MNAMDYARENHQRWSEVEELVRILGHMDDLLMRVMRDVKERAEAQRYEMVTYALENDVDNVLSTVYDIHLRMRMLCAEGDNQADTFEIACDKVQVAS